MFFLAFYISTEYICSVDMMCQSILMLILNIYDMANKYDKSKIMAKAWNIYKHSYMSFSDALRESWLIAKREIEQRNKLAALQPKKVCNARLGHVYQNCQFGRNDWAIDHQNDARIAIGHALKLRRLNNHN